MIFHDYGYHMMDMGFGNWLYMILGAGVILLSIITLIYLFIHYINLSNSKNQLKNNMIDSNEIKSNITDVEETDLGKPDYCHNCGQKLDDKSVKFCPYCGERIL